MIEDKNGIKILYAEDKAEDQMILKLVLERLGYEADVVHTGEGVIRALREKEYDCLFMDLELKGMNGAEATRCIRRHEKESGSEPIFIAALTGYDSPAAKKMTLESGADAYITKPYEYGDIARVLSEVLKYEAV